MKTDRRKKFMLCTMTIVFILLTTVFGSAAALGGTVIVDKAIMRNAATLDSAITNTLSIGTKIFINEMKEDWYLVNLPEGNVSGWMYKDLILVEETERTKVQKGVSTASLLNIRLNPSTDAAIVTRIANGTQVSIINSTEDWFEVIMNTGQKGWASSEYIRIVPNLPQGIIIEENVNIFSAKETSSTILGSLDLDDMVYIKNYDDGWYNIVKEDFTEGWVQINNINVHIGILSPVNRSGLRTGKLNDISSTVTGYLGKRYVYGASGPNSFDCSGFVSYILKTYYGDYLKEKGINLPRSSRDQAKVGTPVSRDQLQMGDLVFFNNGSSKTINHVGIYLENGIFIHASSGKSMSVIKSTLNEGTYLRRYSMAVRL
jgi:uncharacterized protein YgiM (DUF1202 family)